MLLESCVEKRKGVRTSRRSIRSWTRLITCAIVASVPPSPLEGRANSIDLPLRSKPRASRRLLTYVDAVLRLNESIDVVQIVCAEKASLKPSLDNVNIQPDWERTAHHMPLLAPSVNCLTQSCDRHDDHTSCDETNGFPRRSMYNSQTPMALIVTHK